VNACDRPDVHPGKSTFRTKDLAGESEQRAVPSSSEKKKIAVAWRGKGIEGRAKGPSNRRRTERLAAKENGQQARAKPASE